MAGMTAAAIVAGNTVVLKPSSDSPTIAAKFVEVAGRGRHAGWRGEFLPRLGRGVRQRDCGTPEDTVHRVHRLEELWAWRFTSARRMRSQARSGSSARFWRWAARIPFWSAKTQISTQQCRAWSLSAFGFSGQKCSACSRAIVEAPLYDVFVERVRERVADADGGRSSDQSRLWPCGQQAALNSMLRYIETGKKEGKLVAGGNAPADARGRILY